MTRPTPGGTAALGDRTVARVGYGTMQLEHADPDAAVAVLRRAVELGVDHLDTAQFYGDGTSNTLIRRALSPYDGGTTIVSKVGAERTPDGLVAAQQPHQLRRQVEANLATLGLERLDVVNLRRMDSRPGVVAEGDQVVPMDDQLTELVALRDAGLVGAIGVSNVSAEQLEAALPARPVCVQNAYSALDRTHEPVLAICAREGLAWVPYFPLGSAFPQLPKVTDAPAVVEIAARLGVTPSQVGLAWLLAHDPRTLLIAGTRSVAHLEENLAAGDVVLTPDDVARLDALAG